MKVVMIDTQLAVTHGPVTQIKNLKSLVGKLTSICGIIIYTSSFTANGKLAKKIIIRDEEGK